MKRITFGPAKPQQQPATPPDESGKAAQPTPDLSLHTQQLDKEAQKRQGLQTPSHTSPEAALRPRATKSAPDISATSQSKPVAVDFHHRRYDIRLAKGQDLVLELKHEMYRDTIKFVDLPTNFVQQRVAAHELPFGMTGPNYVTDHFIWKGQDLGAPGAPVQAQVIWNNSRSTFIIDLHIDRE